MKKINKISVIYSFYNEENVIKDLLDRTRKTLSTILLKEMASNYEIIFVNDCSTDNSKNLLINESKVDNLVVLSMSRNFGVSECVLAGMEYSSGDVVIYLDADLQDPPELMEEMVAIYLADPDAEVVYTTRSRRYGEHWLKLLVTKLGYRLIKLASDIDLPLDSGDYKLLSRKVVNKLLTLKEDRPYIRGLISWIGFKQVSILYDRDPRFDGAKNNKMKSFSKRVIYYWLDRALISFSDAPLKIMLFVGGLLSLISIAYILVIFTQKLLGLSVPGFAAIMSAILLIGGFQLMMLGFIGLYIGSIFRETKNRFRYIVKSVAKDGIEKNVG